MIVKIELACPEVTKIELLRTKRPSKPWTLQCEDQTLRLAVVAGRDNGHLPPGLSAS